MIKIMRCMYFYNNKWFYINYPLDVPKEEMYINVQILGERGYLHLLDDDEIKASLRSMQHDTAIIQGERSKTKIFGNDSHISEGIVRGVWMATKDKTLNIYIY